MATLAGGVLVDADQPRSGHLRLGKSFDQAQDSAAADGHPEGRDQASAGPASQGETDRDQSRPQPLGPLTVPAGQAGYLLARPGGPLWQARAHPRDRQHGNRLADGQFRGHQPQPRRGKNSRLLRSPLSLRPRRARLCRRGPRHRPDRLPCLAAARLWAGGRSATTIEPMKPVQKAHLLDFVDVLANWGPVTHRRT